MSSRGLDRSIIGSLNVSDTIYCKNIVCKSLKSSTNIDAPTAPKLQYYFNDNFRIIVEGNEKFSFQKKINNEWQTRASIE